MTLVVVVLGRFVMLLNVWVTDVMSGMVHEVVLGRKSRNREAGEQQHKCDFLFHGPTVARDGSAG